MDAQVVANETMVPVLPCTDPVATVEFWRALGFEVTYEQMKPYVYLAFEWSGFEVHYGRAAATVNPEEENTGGCLAMVDAVAPYHAAFTAAMRESYGKVLARGLPRITRYRAGASRFTIVDPSGNSLIFIQRDEPEGLEYGGSQDLVGLARVLDNARIFREFKTDDLAAFRTLKSGLRRYGDTAPWLERAKALALLIELSAILDEVPVQEWGEQLSELELTPEEQAEVGDVLTELSLLRAWLPDLS